MTDTTTDTTQDSVEVEAEVTPKRRTITQIEAAISTNAPVTKWEHARVTRVRLREADKPKASKAKTKAKPAKALTVEDLAAHYNVRV